MGYFCQILMMNFNLKNMKHFIMRILYQGNIELIHQILMVMEKINRGHFIVAHADFAYDDNALSKTYTMANIIPQSAKTVNQKTWVKVEKYGRLLC